MAIMTWDDTQKNTPSGPSNTKVWEKMKEQLELGEMPPRTSAAGALTAEQKLGLTNWLDAGAQKGSCP